MVINKSVLAKKLKDAGIPYRTVLLCIDTLLAAMSEGLAGGQKIELRGLGSLSVRKTAARGTSINGNMAVPEHWRVVFRPCEELRKKVWNCGKTN
jgi:nucleoid DNA-binding protein